MSMTSVAAVLLLSAQASADNGLPPLTVTGSPDQGLKFAVERFPVAQWRNVDAKILVEANRRCRPKVASFNSYSVRSGNVMVNGKAVPGVLRYERTMICAAPTPKSAPAPITFDPSNDDAMTAFGAFNTYFAAVDGERVDLVERLTDGPPMPPALAVETMRAMKAEAGAGRRIPFALTWSTNAPDQPHSGIFVDIFYYQKLPGEVTICGRALFYRADAKTYRFSRNLVRQADTPTDGRTPPCSLFKRATSAGPKNGK